MRKHYILSSLAVLTFWGTLSGPALVTFAVAGEVLSARQIMEKNFYVTKVKTLKAVSTMVLINPQGEKRERKLTNLQKLQANGVDSRLLAKFLEPADVRGTGFLQVEHSDADDDQWIFLPALAKSRRLVANNKKDSFFGSDFSYGDITLPKVDAYRHTLKGSEVIGGKDYYVIESVPANDSLKADTGYSKKVSWIRKDNFLEGKVDYYDLNGALLKTQLAADHKKLETNPERWLAQRREMTNVQTGHKTIFTFDQVKAGIVLDDGAFTTRSLERP